MSNVLDLIARSIEKLTNRKKEASKTECGRLLIIAGSKYLPTPAYLNALASLRSGAGWIMLAIPKGITIPLQSSLLDVKLHFLEESTDGSICLSSIDPLINEIKKFNTVLIGSGLVISDENSRFVIEFMQRSSKVHPDLTWVIDTGAFKPLYEIRNCSSIRWEKQIWLPNNWELKMLFGEALPKLKNDQLEFIQKHIDYFGMIWIHKGHCSEVLSPANETIKISTGNPGMAVMGMGDVLAGIIASLLAQGINIIESAVLGTYLHGHR